MLNLIKKDKVQQWMIISIKVLKEKPDSIPKEVKIKLFSEANSKKVFHFISNQINPSK